MKISDLPAFRGVMMGSKESPERMVIAVPEMEGLTIDTQPYFRLNSLKQDLLLKADGGFYQKFGPKVNNDYGAAISVTFHIKTEGDNQNTGGHRFGFPAAVVRGRVGV